METLPEEILIKIASYLPTCDLIQFSKCCNGQYDHFFKKKEIARSLNFNRNFLVSDMYLCSFIQTNVAYKHVRSLNINCLYWIPAEDLRKCLGNLVFLEELFAIDTQLNLEAENCRIYAHLDKLRKVALSVEPHEFCVNLGDYFPSINSMLLKLTQTQSHWRYDFLDIYKFNQLEELWIILNNTSSDSWKIRFANLPFTTPMFRKYILVSDTYSYLPLSQYMGLSKIYDSKRFGWNELIFERLPDMMDDMIPNSEVKVWQLWSDSHLEYPYGPSDAHALYVGGKTLETIDFEKLNFTSLSVPCSTKFNMLLLSVLDMENCFRLKSLGVQTCVLQMEAFQRLKNKFDYVEELEVWSCSQYCPLFSPSKSKSFDKFRFSVLKKLTIEVPAADDGAFLETVFTGCTQLQSLRLNCLQENKSLNENLYAYLHLARTLVDLRIQLSNISLDKLFASLIRLETNKLQRIFLQFSTCETPYVDDDINSFFENNLQVVFFYLLVEDKSFSTYNIHSLLIKHKKKNEAKVFYAKNELLNETTSYPVPLAHHDLYFFNSVATNIDIYKDFS